MTPWLLCINFMMVVDLIGFEDEPTFKSTFVRLIGSHTTLFVILCYASLVCFSAGLDSVLLGVKNLWVLVYMPSVIAIINQLMETKNLQKSMIGTSVFLISSMCLVAYLYGQLETKDFRAFQAKRETPLFVKP